MLLCNLGLDRRYEISDCLHTRTCATTGTRGVHGATKSLSTQEQTSVGPLNTAVLIGSEKSNTSGAQHRGIGRTFGVSCCVGTFLEGGMHHRCGRNMPTDPVCCCRWRGSRPQAWGVPHLLGPGCPAVRHSPFDAPCIANLHNNAPHLRALCPRASPMDILHSAWPSPSPSVSFCFPVFGVGLGFRLPKSMAFVVVHPPVVCCWVVVMPNCPSFCVGYNPPPEKKTLRNTANSTEHRVSGLHLRPPTTKGFHDPPPGP